MIAWVGSAPTLRPLVMAIGVRTRARAHGGLREQPALLHAESSTHGRRRRVRERLAGDESLTMSELRELLGTTRKYSVPIGEYLDRIGLTRREGDVRRLNVSEQPPSSESAPVEPAGS